MTIDWLKLNNYNIEDIYKATLEKSKTALKKAVKKAGIEGLKEGEDYIELDISKYTNTYKAYVPLHWDASKLIASPKIGGCEGKWCTAYQKDSSHWKRHTEDTNAVLIYLVNTNKPEKYAIKYYVNSSEILIWDFNDNEMDRKSFEKITDIDVSIFHTYSSILKKVLQKIKENRVKIYYKTYKDYLEGKKYVEDIEILKQIINECIDPSKDIKKLKIGTDNLRELFSSKDLSGYDISEWDVSRVTSMEGMFYGVKFQGDISNWDVSNVKNMKSMFDDSDFNGDISKWDVSNVEDMSYMFAFSKFSGDISNWDVSNVRNMSNMFYNSVFNGDISNWNVSNVKDMSHMFNGSQFNGDISQWDVSNVKYMSGMFSYSKFNGDISEWDVSNVEYMDSMFKGSKFNGDISNWDVSNVINMSNMFEESEFNGDISQWNVSNVKSMYYMFCSSKFNRDISQWNVSNVVNMSSMFEKSEFNGDISKWDVSNVIDMSYMFYRSNFNGDISKWNVSNVEDMNGMFYRSKFSGDISNWNVSNVHGAYEIFTGSPLEKRYPNGLEDLKKEQQRKKENVIKKFLYNYLRRGIIIRIEEKKDHLIVKHKDFNSLPQEKQEWLINYFKSRDNPPNMDIDWLKLDTYNIEDIYKATLEKSKTALKKAVKKAGIEGLEEGEDYIELDISKYTNTYRAYIPLHWEASKLIASSKIGGCEGKWCTAYQKNSSFWKEHTIIDNAVLIYVVNTNKPEKYVIKYYLEFSEIVIWDSNDNKMDLKSFEEITHITASIFHNYFSIFQKAIRKIKDNNSKIYYKKYKDYLEGKKYIEDIETLQQIVDECPDRSKHIKKLKIGVDNLEKLFSSKDLEGYDISEWDVSRVTSMDGLFSRARSIGDISKWNVSNVKSMRGMFSDSDFNGDISQWDVSNVEDMSYMFRGSTFNGDISHWNVSKVENMFSMFADSEFNGDISNWNVSNVKSMEWMFANNSKFNGDISQWDVSNVIDMSCMFHNSIFNGDISKWNVSRVRKMEAMFRNSEFNGDISKWDVSNVISMGQMFCRSKFNGDISQWDVSNVRNMVSMFEESEFNGDISNWDVSNVEDMGLMFQKSKFNGDISHWDVSKVRNMSDMFAYSEFNGDISNWNVSNVKSMASMFRGSNFTGDISNWNVSNVEDMNNMFYEAKFSGDISKWNVSNVRGAYRIFDRSPLEKRYPNGLKDLIKEQQSKNENVIKKFLDNSIWRDV